MGKIKETIEENYAPDELNTIGDSYSEFIQPSLSHMLQYYDKWEAKLNEKQLEFAGTDPDLPKKSKSIFTE